MPDSGYSSATADDIDGKECGNGVVLDHGKRLGNASIPPKNRGSISVKTDKKWHWGETLGFVGQSGQCRLPPCSF